MLEGGEGMNTPRRGDHHHPSSHRNDREHLPSWQGQEGIRSTHPHTRWLLRTFYLVPRRVEQLQRALKIREFSTQKTLSFSKFGKHLEAPGIQNSRPEMLNRTSHHTKGKRGDPNPTSLITIPSKNPVQQQRFEEARRR